ncbi:collagen-like protein (plasmid) [Borrelia coriaceae]|uniref:Lipoprotein n=1 Tax=Borrelia coriaceae ATCC 43381 TaxID=1408429 RepID=W5SW79_9SPIR|nr:collagen-like protein [Borrelia coriaceae]AHH11147.1 Hypothetical protein BCO_0025400 [Borrelia coriaceae ATCC 43381]UPA16979.1 collagen-like protein [Borrelia coriaceae]
MKRVCMVICLLSTFLGCSGPAGPRGFMGDRGPDGNRGDIGHGLRGDFELLEASVFLLKSSYDYNYKILEPNKAGFDTSIPFGLDIFQNEFSTQESKDYVYVALNNDERYINILKQIIEKLTKPPANSRDKDAAKKLLLALRDSAECIHQVINLFLTSSGTVKFVNNDRSFITELNVFLMMIFRQRKNVVDDIKKILSKVEPSLTMGNIPNFRNEFKSITEPDGEIYKKIYIGADSLRGLRGIIKNRIDASK